MINNTKIANINEEILFLTTKLEQIREEYEAFLEWQGEQYIEEDDVVLPEPPAEYWQEKAKFEKEWLNQEITDNTQYGLPEEKIIISEIEELKAQLQKLVTKNQEKEIKKQDTNPVRHYFWGLAKLINSDLYTTTKKSLPIFEERLLKGESLPVSMSNKNKKQQIEISILNSDELKDVFHFMTGFDVIVTNAINSEIKAGNNDFTIRQIAKIIYGRKTMIGSTQIESIYKTIEKLASTRLKLDCSKLVKTKEIKLNGKKLNAIIRCNAYSCKGITLKTANGKIDDGAYHFFEPPIFSQITEQQKQITTIPCRLVNAVLNKFYVTEEILNQFWYLIERIAHMKSANNKNKNFEKIKYETIINSILKRQRKELPVNKKTYEKLKRRIKDNTKKMLSIMQDENHIKGFEEYNDGHRYPQGIRILLQS